MKFGKISQFSTFILDELKKDLQIGLGYDSYSLQYEEMMLYSLAANQDLFCTEMFRYAEAQLYKKFMDVIPILQRGYLDSRLMNGIRFYARFLAIYILEMKINCVTRDKNYLDRSLIKQLEDYKEYRERQYEKNTKKWKKREKKHPWLKYTDCNDFAKKYFKRKGRKYNKKRIKQKSLWENIVQLGFKSEDRKNIDLKFVYESKMKRYEKEMLL
jgi:hypothetical protein